MGFLDLLSGKKSGPSAPPSAPGAPKPAPEVASNVNSSAPNPPTPSIAPPMPGAPPGTDAKSGDSDTAPATPKIQNPDPKAIFNAMHNENPPPEFKPDELNLPKFDLPNFPKNYPELNFDIPSYGKAAGSAPAPNGAPGAVPTVQAPGVEPVAPEAEVVPETPSAPESNDELSTTIPEITTLSGSKGRSESAPVAPTSESPSAPDVAPVTSSAPVSPATPGSLPSDPFKGKSSAELDKEFSKREQFLTPQERELTDEKALIHAPRNEPGTDKRRIGNVEGVIERRTQIPKGPVFIEINDYKRVLNGVDEIKRDANESQEMILKLEEFNDKKHSEFEKWKKIFENINTKLKFIDKTMFEQSD